MTTTTNEKRKPGRPKKASLEIKTLQDLKNIVEYLGPKHVKRLAIDGIEIEFDTVTAAINKENERLESGDSSNAGGPLVSFLQDQLKDEAELLDWSTPQKR